MNRQRPDRRLRARLEYAVSVPLLAANLTYRQYATRGAPRESASARQRALAQSR